MMLPNTGRGRQMLEAIFNPTYRVTHAHRQPPNRHFLGMKDVLVTKAASNVRRNDTDASLLKAETFGQTGAHNMGKLRGTVQGELIRATVPEGDHPFALHRHSR